MQAARFNSSVGRSRKARRRQSADVRFAQMHIKDYLEGQVTLCRDVPIGKRREFLPTVCSRGIEHDPRHGAQMVLCLDAETVRSTDRQERALLLPDLSQRVAELRVAELHVVEEPAVAFGVRRFLYGCLLGSGVAAVILLAVTFVV